MSGPFGCRPDASKAHFAYPQVDEAVGLELSLKAIETDLYADNQDRNPLLVRYGVAVPTMKTLGFGAVDGVAMTRTHDAPRDVPHASGTSEQPVDARSHVVSGVDDTSDATTTTTAPQNGSVAGDTTPTTTVTTTVPVSVKALTEETPPMECVVATVPKVGMLVQAEFDGVFERGIVRKIFREKENGKFDISVLYADGESGTVTDYPDDTRIWPIPLGTGVWYRLANMQDINAYMAALNERGIRESTLKRNLELHKDILTASMRISDTSLDYLECIEEPLGPDRNLATKTVPDTFCRDDLCGKLVDLCQLLPKHDGQYDSFLGKICHVQTPEDYGKLLQYLDAHVDRSVFKPTAKRQDSSRPLDTAANAKLLEAAPLVDDELQHVTDLSRSRLDGLRVEMREVDGTVRWGTVVSEWNRRKPYCPHALYMDNDDNPDPRRIMVHLDDDDIVWMAWPHGRVSLHANRKQHHKKGANKLRVAWERKVRRLSSWSQAYIAWEVWECVHWLLLYRWRRIYRVTECASRFLPPTIELGSTRFTCLCCHVPP